MSDKQQSEALRLADELDSMSERITRFSNSPGDGLCAAGADELRRLDLLNAELVEALNGTNASLEAIGDYAHEHSTGPATWDPLWEVRSMAYDNVRVVDSALTASPATVQVEQDSAELLEWLMLNTDPLEAGLTLATFGNRDDYLRKYREAIRAARASEGEKG